MKADILLLLVCLFFTLYNTGVIWVLQLNHYPLYAKVGQREFRDYMTAHNGRILLPIVLPSIAALYQFIVTSLAATCRNTKLECVAGYCVECGNLALDNFRTRSGA